MQEKILNALTEWILRVISEKNTATPEEITALPEVANTLLRYLASFEASSPFIKNE